MKLSDALQQCCLALVAQRHHLWQAGLAGSECWLNELLDWTSKVQGSTRQAVGGEESCGSWRWQAGHLPTCWMLGMPLGSACLVAQLALCVCVCRMN